MEVDKLFASYAGRTLNLPDDQLNEILYAETEDGSKELNPNALDALLELDQKRIQAKKVNTKEYFDNGYSKGKKETLTRYEQKLKQLANLSTEATGDDLLTEFIQAATKPPKMDEDKIKSHPVFIQAEQSFKKQLEEQEKQFQQEIQKINQTAAKEQIWAQASKVIADEFLKLNPVLSKDATKAQNQVNNFIGKFSNFDWIQEGNDFYPAKEGKRLENEHGHAIKLSDLVKRDASNLFDFNLQKPKGSGGNKNNEQSVNIPKTEEEYLKAINEATTREERVQINKAWNAAKKS